jgi:hypothetical protein
LSRSDSKGSYIEYGESLCRKIAAGRLFFWRKGSFIVESAQRRYAKLMPNCQQIQTVKTFQNPLDNSVLKCYNMRALNERHREDLRMKASEPRTEPRDHEKVFKKLFKNLLTNARECDIIIESLCERLNLVKDLEKDHKKV